MLGYLAQVFDAHASMMCKRIEQLDAVSDKQSIELLKAYGQALKSSKPIQFSQHHRFFFMMFATDEDCRSSSCFYRLLELKDGVVRERFTFQGTGAILLFSAGEYWEIFQDHYWSVALETSPQAHLWVSLPLKGDTILVKAGTLQQVRMPTC
jgi:hypothetical protein